MKISHWYILILFFILITPFVVQAQTSGTASTCGNAKLEGTEACDDGNTADNDGCSNQCYHEIADGVCGNGTIDKYEQCDDGDNVSGDGCTATCGQEFCHTYDNTTTPPTVTSYLTTMESPYYAGVACPSDPQPAANTGTGEPTLTCADGTAASESVCVVDEKSQLKCFTKDTNSEIVTLGTITGTVTDVEKVGADNILVVATFDNGVYLVNTIKQEVMQHLTFDQIGAVKSLAIAKDYGYILNDKNEILKTNELRTAEVFYTFTATEKAPLALAATLDDNSLYALLADGSIKAWVVDSANGTTKVEHHAGVKSLTNAATVFTIGDILITATPDLTKTNSYKKAVLIADAINKQIVQIADLSYQAKAEVLIKDLSFAPSALTLGKDQVLVTDKSLAEKLYAIDKTFNVTEYSLAGITKPDKIVTTQLCGFAEIDMLPPVKTPVCDDNSVYNPDSAMCECISGYSRQLDSATNESACLVAVVLAPTCPENSTLIDAKCICATGYTGSITTDSLGNPLLTCTADAVPLEPVKRDPADLAAINPIGMVNSCPKFSTLSDVTGKCECDEAGYWMQPTADGKSIVCELKPSVEPACPDYSAFDETKKRCECDTGYIMQATGDSIACVENPAPVLDKASCPENSLYNDITEKCECIADHTASVITNANGVSILVCTSNDVDLPTKTEIDECPNKSAWNDNLADCACKEGLVAIRDCDGFIIRCVDPKDSYGGNGGNTTTTNTTNTNTNTNTTVTNTNNTTKVTTVNNTTNNTNTNVTVVGGTQSAGTQSATPVSNTGGVTSSGSFTNSVESAFTPAAAVDDGGATPADDDGTSAAIDPDADEGGDAPTGDDTPSKQPNAALRGGVSCSLTQTGTGTSHHEGFLGLMMLVMLVVLRLAQRRI